MVFSPKVMHSALNILGGPALPAQYLCIVTPPMGMLIQGSAGLLGGLLSVAGSANLAVMATSVSIPGRAFATQDSVMFGTTRKMPYGVIYDSIRVSFLCTNSMFERTFFDAWHQFIISPSSQYIEYYDNYKADIVIKKLKGSGLDSILAFEPPTVDPPLAELGSVLSTYIIEEAYPYRIGAQELSSENNDAILRLDVEFYYRRWRSVIDMVFPGRTMSPGGL
jgi:hypothetical protein